MVFLQKLLGMGVCITMLFTEYVFNNFFFGSKNIPVFAPTLQVCNAHITVLFTQKLPRLFFQQIEIEYGYG